jgi:hypothetical protein
MFIHNDNIINPIDEKVSMLYEFCILIHPKVKGKGKEEVPDDREPAVRTVLGNCKNEIQMEQVLHDVVIGNTTIDTMLKRKGLM